jgi:hypothetical protein
MTERFTLLSELGRGGMGVVWKARDEETGQIVALKLLRESYADDPDYLARFERELELAKRIHSQHVVKVLGFGVRRKTPYLSLEYVDGPSLHEALQAHGPYGWPEARALLIQVAQGLADAHAADIIHRDVKPSNVLIGADGVAKLTDFGIARGLDLTRVTATSTMLGTPAYLAPEGPVDTRSDLYSLGIIGYELLAGSPPFVGTTYQQIILAHVRTPPDLDRLPAEGRPIVGWLLEKDADERPQNGQELLAVLRGRLMLPGTVAPSIAPSVPVVVVPRLPAADHPKPGRAQAPASLRLRDAGRFTRGALMNVPRERHAATPLADGRVLITGGWHGSGAVAAAETFDPASGNIAIAATPLWARMDHTATLLPDGKVLLAGGCDGPITFASAEAYDPTTGLFSGLPGMKSARHAHTATLLRDGRVLMIGGCDRRVPITEIEAFEPTTGTFSSVGELLRPRWRHAATLLPSGRVLITGGSAKGLLTDDAELYDPRTQESDYVGHLTKPRRAHTAVVLHDGRVLIAGGEYESPIDLAEIYVPRTGGFSAVGFMMAARSGNSATVLADGRVLIAGGLGPDRLTRSAELFYPDSNLFVSDASMTVAREGHTATLLANGNVLIVGGKGYDGGVLASTEVYSL